MAAWTQSSALAASAYGYPYDSSALAAYGYGGAYGLAATRKNVTRESTATLKAWLNEHKKNPYPTKGEKIMLAIISKMTLTQVNILQLLFFSCDILILFPFLKVMLIKKYKI